MTEARKSRALRAMTAEITGSYLIQHPRAAEEVARVIRTIHDTLAALESVAAMVPDVPSPAVPVKRSVGTEHLVCLDCGTGLKTLKRHLRAVHGLDPRQYRAKWNLPPSYPMVAPGYAQQRSRHAKSMGLGKRTAKGR